MCITKNVYVFILTIQLETKLERLSRTGPPKAQFFDDKALMLIVVSVALYAVSTLNLLKLLLG